MLCPCTFSSYSPDWHLASTNGCGPSLGLFIGFADPIMVAAIISALPCTIVVFVDTIMAALSLSVSNPFTVQGPNLSQIPSEISV
ncbi:hypothetical protein SUGI_0513210 [Cryptomeria japonica]|nr:hypothetical protein SUGI_0513210 [Cryptomeria japonica]